MIDDVDDMDGFPFNPNEFRFSFPLWLIEATDESNVPESVGIATNEFEGRPFLPIFTDSDLAQRYSDSVPGMGEPIEVPDLDTLREIAGYLSRNGCPDFGMDPPVEPGGRFIRGSISFLFR